MESTVSNSSSDGGSQEWSQEEIDRLEEAIALFGSDWQKIAEYVERLQTDC